MNNNNLKYVREELEMTQEELGLVFGVKGSTVAGWENNNDSIPLSKLVKYLESDKIFYEYYKLSLYYDEYKQFNKNNHYTIFGKLKEDSVKEYIKKNLELEVITHQN